MHRRVLGDLSARYHTRIINFSGKREIKTEGRGDWRGFCHDFPEKGRIIVCVVNNSLYFPCCSAEGRRRAGSPPACCSRVCLDVLAVRMYVRSTYARMCVGLCGRVNMHLRRPRAYVRICVCVWVFRSGAERTTAEPGKQNSWCCMRDNPLFLRAVGGDRLPLQAGNQAAFHPSSRELRWQDAM